MELYSSDYQNQLILIHNKIPWGGAVKGKVPEIIFYAKLLNINDILDYGCGYGYFKLECDKLYPDHNYLISEYDPGIISKSHPPTPQNMVICIDVLEHIEPDYVDNVLDDLKRLTLNICVLGISLIPSHILLPDGRNAHLNIHDTEWWVNKINGRFDILKVNNNNSYCKIILKKK